MPWHGCADLPRQRSSQQRSFCLALFVQEWPPIERLPVHEEDKQSVTLPEHMPMQTSLERAGKTKLMAWFELNRHEREVAETHPDTLTPAHRARETLYQDIPQFYTWHQKTRTWRPRKRNPWPVGRMYSCSSKDRERYCLRLLLLRVRGAESWDDLKVVDGELCPTFHEAARRRHLLDDDSEYDLGLLELATHVSAARLRQHFANLLLWAGLSTPLQLWEKYKKQMAEDILHSACCSH